MRRPKSLPLLALGPLLAASLQGCGGDATDDGGAGDGGEDDRGTVDPSKPGPTTYASLDDAIRDLHAKAIEGPEAAAQSGACGKTTVTWMEGAPDATMRSWNVVTGERRELPVGKVKDYQGFASETFVSVIGVGDPPDPFHVAIHPADGGGEPRKLAVPSGNVPLGAYATDNAVAFILTSAQGQTVQRWDAATTTVEELGAIVNRPNAGPLAFARGRLVITSNHRAPSELHVFDVDAKTNVMIPLDVPPFASAAPSAAATGDGVYYAARKADGAPDLVHVASTGAPGTRSIGDAIASVPPLWKNGSTDGDAEHGFVAGVATYRDYVLYMAKNNMGVFAYDTQKNTVLPVQPRRFGLPVFCVVSDPQMLVLSAQVDGTHRLIAIPLANVLP